MNRILFASAILVAAGCNGTSPLPPGVGAAPGPLPPPLTAPAPILAEPAAPGSDEKTKNLQFILTAGSATLPRGRMLALTMELHNGGKDAQTLDFPSGQDFEIEARRVEKGAVAPAVVWKWSENKMFTMIYRQVAVEGGRSLKFTAAWDGTAGGERLRRGEYELTAFTASTPCVSAPPIRVALK